MNTLDDWSKILDRQSERRSEELKVALAALTQQTRELDPSVYSNEDLLTVYENVPRSSLFEGEAFEEQYEIARTKLRTEIFRRMAR